MAGVTSTAGCDIPGDPLDLWKRKSQVKFGYIRLDMHVQGNASHKSNLFHPRKIQKRQDTQNKPSKREL